MGVQASRNKTAQLYPRSGGNVALHATVQIHEVVTEGTVSLSAGVLQFRYHSTDFRILQIAAEFQH